MRELTEQFIGLAIEVRGVQVLSYSRMRGLRVGLLFNFHAPLLKDGFRSVLLRGPSCSPC